MVLVHVDSIDGPLGTIAHATYCHYRLADGTPVVSATIFDEADLDLLVEYDAMEAATFHEFAHGLGFGVGTQWDNLLETGDDPHFTGALAIAAFDAAGGTGYTGAKVPVESAVSGHWSESVLGLELMTSRMTLGAENPYSAITIQAMADMGYAVDTSFAEDYELPDVEEADIAAHGAERVLNLHNDVVRVPVMVVGADGRVVRVISPPPGSTVPYFGRHEARSDPRAPREGRAGRPAPDPSGREPMWRLVRPASRRPPQ